MINILLFQEDIQKYPPVLSIIDVLLKNNQEVYVLGYCSNKETIAQLTRKGVHYFSFFKGNDGLSKLARLYNLIDYKRKVYKYIENNKKKITNSVFWLFNERTFWLFKKIVPQYKSILYLFEVPNLNIPLKYKIFIQTKEYRHLIKKVWRVVCCEYNRARIVESFFGLDKTPYIIPNKPSVDTSSINHLDKNLEDLFVGNKVILYQGAFNYPERKLDELCDSIKYLPSEYHIALMGASSKYKDKLHGKYKSDRIHFIPFTPSPHHLSITRKAYIGFLTYGDMKGDIVNVLNTLYCAPNKVYEYSLFSIPMVSSNNPALRDIFNNYEIGLAVNEYSAQDIAKAVITIDKEYSFFRKKCKFFYDAVNIEQLIMNLIN